MTTAATTLATAPITAPAPATAPGAEKYGLRDRDLGFCNAPEPTGESASATRGATNGATNAATRADTAEPREARGGDVQGARQGRTVDASEPFPQVDEGFEEKSMTNRTPFAVTLGVCTAVSLAGNVGAATLLPHTLTLPTPAVIAAASVAPLLLPAAVHLVPRAAGLPKGARGVVVFAVIVASIAAFALSFASPASTGSCTCCRRTTATGRWSSLR